MSDVIVAPETRDLARLGNQLCAWLSTRMPGASNLAISNLAYPRGAGQSHESILFDAAWCADGRAQSRGFVLRIKPMRHTVYPDDLFEEQYQLMSVLHAHGRVRVALYEKAAVAVSYPKRYAPSWKSLDMQMQPGRSVWSI